MSRGSNRPLSRFDPVCGQFCETALVAQITDDFGQVFNCEISHVAKGGAAWAGGQCFRYLGEDLGVHALKALRLNESPGTKEPLGWFAVGADL